MTKETLSLFEEIQKNLFEKAEDAARTNESHQTTVEIELHGQLFEFALQVDVENYKYDEETNSADYDVEVTCNGFKGTEDPDLVTLFNTHILFETLYSEHV